MTKQHKVLVYGTLRPGCWNYETFLRGHTTNEENIRLGGFKMYGTKYNGFPYVTFGDGEITATLVTLKHDHYEHVMQSLDYLEGYRGPDVRNHYDRELISFLDDDGEKVTAWIYVVQGATAAHIAAERPETLEGDWVLQTS
jgi:gamma-glutamylcyclotransferase (GGCT)/AIG2-like uncharacterized protein YtfP